MILHTITCTRYSRHYGAYVETTKHLIRRRKLTPDGCERILNRELANEPKYNVIRVEYAVIEKRS